jgi:ankyrin repeat protein
MYHFYFQHLLTLSKFGADPNIKTKLGITPLHEAIRANSVDIVKILLEVTHLNRYH